MMISLPFDTPVMGAALRDFNAVIRYAVNKTVHIVYPARPETLKISLQRLWLTLADIAVAVNVFKQIIYAFQLPWQKE